MSYMGHLGGKARRTNGGGGYNILPMPQIQAPPVSDGTATPPIVATPPPTSDPLASVMGLLDGDVMGIPIKYIAIGVVAYFLMKK